MATLDDLRRWTWTGAIGWALATALTTLLAISACGSEGKASPEAGPIDGSSPSVDLCNAFTGVGTTCPVASPRICFPMCEAGGCFCSDTADGPRWGCVTDTSCEPSCAPVDDACASDAGLQPSADTRSESGADATSD